MFQGKYILFIYTLAHCVRNPISNLIKFKTLSHYDVLVLIYQNLAYKMQEFLLNIAEFAILLKCLFNKWRMKNNKNNNNDEDVT